MHKELCSFEGHWLRNSSLHVCNIPVWLCQNNHRESLQRLLDPLLLCPETRRWLLGIGFFRMEILNVFSARSIIVELARLRSFSLSNSFLRLLSSASCSLHSLDSRAWRDSTVVGSLTFFISSNIEETSGWPYSWSIKLKKSLLGHYDFLQKNNNSYRSLYTLLITELFLFHCTYSWLITSSGKLSTYSVQVTYRKTVTTPQ